MHSSMNSSPPKTRGGELQAVSGARAERLVLPADVGDDEDVEHHDGAGVDDDLRRGDELRAQQQKQRREAQQVRDERQHRVERVAHRNDPDRPRHGPDPGHEEQHLSHEARNLSALTRRGTLASGRVIGKASSLSDLRRWDVAEPTLKKGSKKPEVKDLQEALKALGFSGVGKVDGVFGAATEKAVKAFQASVGIEADGIVGPLTWRNIDEADQSEPVLKKGSKGLPVRRLQSRMTAVQLRHGRHRRALRREDRGGGEGAAGAGGARGRRDRRPGDVGGRQHVRGRGRCRGRRRRAARAVPRRAGKNCITERVSPFGGEVGSSERVWDGFFGQRGAKPLICRENAPGSASGRADNDRGGSVYSCPTCISAPPPREPWNRPPRQTN